MLLTNGCGNSCFDIFEHSLTINSTAVFIDSILFSESFKYNEYISSAIEGRFFIV